MMKKAVRIFVEIFYLVGCSLFAQDYAWPTDASKLMTSSFCELRPRRYHAAIDIKTWNRTGYKIFAIDDGYVYRLRKGATGYGNAIYLKLKDGNYALYGHLDGFIPEYEAYMDSLRLQSQRNSIDKRGLSPALFPVKKGQHIGYTGETGIGVPHLHFEMRDSYNRPINPLQYFKKEMVDNIAPRPRSLAIIPASAHTLINLLPDTLIQSLPADNKMRLRQPIYLTGRAYIALRIFDQADGASNVFDFYKGRLLVNDSLLYSVQYDRFSYDENHLVELDKNFSLQRRGMKSYHNFYRHPANSLPFYGNTPRGGGMLSTENLRDGENTVIIEAEDYFGNEMKLEIPVIYHRYRPVAIQDVQATTDSLKFTLLSADSLGSLTFRQLIPGNSVATALPNVSFVQRFDPKMKHHSYKITAPNSLVPGAVVRVDATYGDDLPLQPLFVWTGSKSVLPPVASTIETVVPFGQELLIKGKGFPLVPGDWQTGTGKARLYDNNKFSVRISAERENPKTPFGDAFDEQLAKWLATDYRIVPGQTRSLRSEDGNFSLRFPSNALHDTLFVELGEVESTVFPPAPYRVLSKTYRTAPFDQPLNYGAYVSLTVPDSIAKMKGVGLYYLTSRGSWGFLPSDFDRQTNTFSARVTSLEHFAVLQDSIPPQISAVRLTASANRNARFGIRDSFSGMFNENQIRVTVNGKWTMFIFDPEEDWIEVETKHLPAGTSTVAISTSDNAGNRVTKEFTVTRR